MRKTGSRSPTSSGQSIPKALSPGMIPQRVDRYKELPPALASHIAKFITQSNNYRIQTRTNTHRSTIHHTQELLNREGNESKEYPNTLTPNLNMVDNPHIRASSPLLKGDSTKKALHIFINQPKETDSPFNKTKYQEDHPSNVSPSNDETYKHLYINKSNFKTQNIDDGFSKITQKDGIGREGEGENKSILKIGSSYEEENGGDNQSGDGPPTQRRAILLATGLVEPEIIKSNKRSTREAVEIKPFLKSTGDNSANNNYNHNNHNKHNKHKNLTRNMRRSGGNISPCLSERVKPIILGAIQASPTNSRGSKQVSKKEFEPLALNEEINVQLNNTYHNQMRYRTPKKEFFGVNSGDLYTYNPPIPSQEYIPLKKTRTIIGKETNTNTNTNSNKQNINLKLKKYIKKGERSKSLEKRNISNNSGIINKMQPVGNNLNSMRTLNKKGIPISMPVSHLVSHLESRISDHFKDLPGNNSMNLKTIDIPNNNSNGGPILGSIVHGDSSTRVESSLQFYDQHNFDSLSPTHTQNPISPRIMHGAPSSLSKRKVSKRYGKGKYITPSSLKLRSAYQKFSLHSKCRVPIKSNKRETVEGEEIAEGSINNPVYRTSKLCFYSQPSTSPRPRVFQSADGGPPPLSPTGLHLGGGPANSGTQLGIGYSPYPTPQQAVTAIANAYNKQHSRPAGVLSLLDNYSFKIDRLVGRSTPKGERKKEKGSGNEKDIVIDNHPMSTTIGTMAVSDNHHQSSTPTHLFHSIPDNPQGKEAIPDAASYSINNTNTNTYSIPRPTHSQLIKMHLHKYLDKNFKRKDIYHSTTTNRIHSNTKLYSGPRSMSSKGKVKHIHISSNSPYAFGGYPRTHDASNINTQETSCDILATHYNAGGGGMSGTGGNISRKGYGAGNAAITDLRDFKRKYDKYYKGDPSTTRNIQISTSYLGGSGMQSPVVNTTMDQGGLRLPEIGANTSTNRKGSISVQPNAHINKYKRYPSPTSMKFSTPTKQDIGIKFSVQLADNNTNKMKKFKYWPIYSKERLFVHEDFADQINGRNMPSGGTALFGKGK